MPATVITAAGRMIMIGPTTRGVIVGIPTTTTGAGSRSHMDPAITAAGSASAIAADTMIDVITATTAGITIHAAAGIIFPAVVGITLPAVAGITLPAVAGITLVTD